MNSKKARTVNVLFGLSLISIGLIIYDGVHSRTKGTLSACYR
jgi:hypothetical protein